MIQFLKKNNPIPDLSDIHCHILPGIDDGAGSVQESYRLLEMEAEDNVKHIVFSPHFNAEKISVSDFLIKRKNALDQIREKVNSLGIIHMEWAEIRITENLLEIPYEKLCMNNSDCLLLEFPFYQYPVWAEPIIDEILADGFVPVLAHVERYPYLMDTGLLRRYVEKGCLSQINAETVINNPKLVKKLVKENLVDVIASDAHHVNNRCPNLLEAFQTGIVPEKAFRFFEK